MYKILLSSPCNSRLERAHPDWIVAHLCVIWVQCNPLNLIWTCRACVLHWLLLLDPRGTEWPAKIKTQFPTPLIESHTLDFRHMFASWSLNPKANLLDHTELKWIYPTAPRTCRFRVIEVDVRCFWARTCVPDISHRTSRSHFSLVSMNQGFEASGTGSRPSVTINNPVSRVRSISGNSHGSASRH